MNCQCGCGLPAPLAKQGESKRGYVKGQPMRFRPGHNQKIPRTAGGYQQRYSPDVGTEYEHIRVAERALGRPLPCGAEVHHVDGDSRNNEPRNLVICQDRAYHKLLHVRARVRAAGGDPNAQRICSTCKQLRKFSEFNRRSGNVGTGLQSACRSCGRARDMARRNDRRVA